MNKYGATGFRLLVADLVLAVSQSLARNAERLDQLHSEIDPWRQTDCNCGYMRRLIAEGKGPRVFWSCAVHGGQAVKNRISAP